MPDQVAYEEEWDGDTITEVKIGVEENGTLLYVAAEPTADGIYEISRVDQRETTLLRKEGLQLLPFALDRLRERFDIEAYGLVDDSKSADELFGGDDLEDRIEAAEIDPEDIVDDFEDDEWEPEQAELREEETPDENAHAKRNAEQLAMAEEELEDDQEEDDVGEFPASMYESAEAYLEDVGEATTADIADAMGIDDSVDVHPELEKIDDDRLVTRPHPDDGRKKLYSLRENGEAPEAIDEGTIVAVAEHYDTLEEVAEDLEVNLLRAHAILEEHGVRDEVVWEVSPDE